MVAVSRDDPVLRLASCNQACADSFLPDVEMQETADLALLVQFHRFLFHPTDEYHLII